MQKNALRPDATVPCSFSEKGTASSGGMEKRTTQRNNKPSAIDEDIGINDLTVFNLTNRLKQNPPVNQI